MRSRSPKSGSRGTERKKTRKPKSGRHCLQLMRRPVKPYTWFSFVITAGGAASVNINCWYRLYRNTYKRCQQLFAKRHQVSRTDHRQQTYFITCSYRTPLSCRLLLILLFRRCFYGSSLLLCRLALLINVISFPLEFNFYILPS